MKITAVGVMSGTSLDGVDLALCCFTEVSGKWKYEILKAVTLDYPDEWKTKLSTAVSLSIDHFLLLNNEYGRYIGDLIVRFLKDQKTPDLVCSHGHTIFHQPEKMFTFQLGNGASIAACCGISTISDFRILDVALGGQGAPLVPMGDQLLFPEYRYCLNLGGFANISFENNHQRIAFDICPVNIVLNYLAGQKGLTFDLNGDLGQSGVADRKLVESLNALEYYQELWPKSLGREWVEQKVIPMLQHSGLSLQDQAASFYEHISLQISRIPGTSGNVLCTGGGTRNIYLMNLLRKKLRCEIIIPREELIDFKEALVFAFLGVLAYQGKVNCLSSVTGAKTDCITGTLFPILKDSEQRRK